MHICLTIILPWFRRKNDAFLQTLKIWQMWYLSMLAYDYASFYQNIEVIRQIQFLIKYRTKFGGLIVIYAITSYTVNKLWSPDTIYWLLYLLLTDPLKSVYHTYLYRISSVDTWDSVCIYSSMINEIGDNMMRCCRNNFTCNVNN